MNMSQLVTIKLTPEDQRNIKLLKEWYGFDRTSELFKFLLAYYYGEERLKYQDFPS